MFCVLCGMFYDISSQGFVSHEYSCMFSPIGVQVFFIAVKTGLIGTNVKITTYVMKTSDNCNNRCKQICKFYKFQTKSPTNVMFPYRVYFIQSCLFSRI